MSENKNSNYNFTTSQSIESESINLKKELVKYLVHWKWFFLTVFVSVALGFTYLRYTPNVYQTNTKIKILKKKESGLDLSGLTGTAPMFDMSTINLANEKAIIKSRRIIGQVVDKLNLTTVYLTSGRLRADEIFGSQVPFVVNWINLDNNRINETFIYSKIDSSSFRLNIDEKDYDKVFEYGQQIQIDDLSLVIHKNPTYNELAYNLSDNKILFRKLPREAIISQLLGLIQAEPISGSDILEITLSGQNMLKNEAILNNLVEAFNYDGVQDDRKIAKKTMEFVSNRVNIIETELDSVENNLVGYKRTSDFIDIGSGNEQIFSTYSSAEQSKSQFETQLQIAKFLQDELNKNTQYGLLPGDVGLESSNAMGLISEYNSLSLQRNRLLASSTESNPLVIKLSEQLQRLKKNIKNTIENYISSIQISLQNVSDRESKFDADIKELPEKEKVVRSIERQASVKENLYIFLLQKQVEADLSAAITAPIAKIVDYAYTSGAPISPKPNIIYLVSILFGFGAPFIFLYIKFLLNTKINSKDQISNKLDIPIIAEVPYDKNYSKKIINQTDSSALAESFRILRTNLNYFDDQLKSSSKVIFATSSTKGEGKTFAAINIASVLVSNKHKTLVIGADLRNPQLHNYIGVPKNDQGLSAYLSNPALNLKDVLLDDDKNLNFDVIISGEIPPNPSELLNNGRLKELLEEAKKEYEYIIVDTAPTILVTDTLAIAKYADLTMYLVRTNLTELKVLDHIKDLKNSKKLKGMAIVVNGIETKKGYGYGYSYGYEYNYGYGYGYSEDKKKKKLYQFLK